MDMAAAFLRWLLGLAGFYPHSQFTGIIIARSGLASSQQQKKKKSLRNNNPSIQSVFISFCLTVLYIWWGERGQHQRKDGMAPPKGWMEAEADLSTTVGGGRSLHPFSLHFHPLFSAF
jgi:hypothetical protein